MSKVSSASKIKVSSFDDLFGMSDVANRFETRKVIITMDNDENRLKKAIAKALNFELLWLLNKKSYYTKVSQEDEARIERMKRQIEMAK